MWQKSVRAHFGTYPYPGGILINYAHEFILEFEKPAPAHVTPEQREASKLEIKKSDVWLMKPEKSGAQRAHVAPFPYELPARLIRAYSFVGETVLDPFLGSGTTLIAARDLKRHGVGYEIHPAFVQQTLEHLQHQRPS